MPLLLLIFAHRRLRLLLVTDWCLPNYQSSYCKHQTSKEMGLDSKLVELLQMENSLMWKLVQKTQAIPLWVIYGRVDWSNTGDVDLYSRVTYFFPCIV